MKTGDLLAMLDAGEYEDKLYELENLIEKYNLLITQRDELIQFYQKKIDSPVTGLYQKAEYMDMLIKCKEERSMYADEAEYAALQCAAYNDRIEAGKLYAGIDGTVSYVRSDALQSKSVAGSSIITILDTSVCAFQSTDSDAASNMSIGENVEIILNSGVKIAGTVTSIDKNSSKILFELDEPDYSLTVGTTASIEMIYEQKKDVLALPAQSVFSTDEYHYVYCLNPEGIRQLVKVEVGLIGNRYVEITGGIEPGTPVIIR